jgi:hypothetical protein
MEGTVNNTNFDWVKFIVNERINTRYKEAEAARQAKLVGQGRPLLRPVVEGAGRALRRAVCLIRALVNRRRRSLLAEQPCGEPAKA